MSYDIKLITDMLQDVAKQKEILILDSLGELVTKGLLVVEETEPVITGNWKLDEDKYEVKLQQKIRLVVKDKEYIEKLEKENKDLHDQINNLKDIFDTWEHNTK